MCVRECVSAYVCVCVCVCVWLYRAVRGMGSALSEFGAVSGHLDIISTSSGAKSQTAAPALTEIAMVDMPVISG